MNDYWQRNFGYCDLYDDMAFMAGIFITPLKISFKYDNKNWMIWMWKRRYGITIGAEIGVYIYSTTYNLEYKGKNYFSMKWYRCANDNERLGINFTLYLKDKKLFSRKSKKTWWLTGFKPNIKNFNIWNLNLKKDLKLEASITFLSLDMAKAFCKSAKLKTPKSKTVSFSWG